MATLQEMFENQTSAASMFDYINYQTGFAIGEKWESEAEVRHYFGYVNDLFPGEPIPENVLKEMEDMVIDNGWWKIESKP